METTLSVILGVVAGAYVCMIWAIGIKMLKQTKKEMK